MRFRAVLTVGVGVLFASCAAGNDSGGDGAAGESTTGATGARGGRGGSANGGTTDGGDAGDDHGGSSGTSQGGASGTSLGGTGAGRDGSAGDGVAAAGGQDDGAGTVTGVVTANGAPNPNVLVAVGSTITYTDADGRFEIPDVAPEYDLVVIVPPESYALVLRGISERTLSISAPGYGIVRGANLAGVLTGGAGAPLPADCQVRMVYEGSGNFVSSFDYLNFTDAHYSMDLLWSGPENVSGFLRAIEYRIDSRGHVLSYDGFGSTPFDVTDRENYAAAPTTTIDLAPVASRTVSGTVTVPSGYFPALDFYVGPFLVYGVYGVPEGTYSTVLPTGIAGIATSVVLWSEHYVDPYNIEASSASYRIDDDVTTLDLSTPAAAVTILPAEATADVDYDTQFSWDGPANSVSTLFLRFERWSVWLVTDATSATIPDLTEYGVSHAPGSEGSWDVRSDVGPTTVDEWTRGEPVAPPSFAWTRSFKRTFTLAN